jgi:hypothetical protein
LKYEKEPLIPKRKPPKKKKKKIWNNPVGIEIEEFD